MAWWYLLLLAAAGVVGYAIWNFRRKTAARQVASAARFERLLGEQGRFPADPSPSAPAETSAAAGATPATSAAPPVATERFLNQSESLLYFLLKAGLPDFEVFAGVSLARVVGAAGNAREREQQLRRLSQYQLDFVICDKNMKVVSVVEIESAAGVEAAGDLRFKSDLLKQAGIRHVRINPAVLPRRDQVLVLVSGEPVQSDGR